MAYYQEVRTYRPVFQKAAALEKQGICLSRDKHIIICWDVSLDCTAECKLGWHDEKVTHLVIEPSSQTEYFLGGMLTEEDFLAWVKARLEFLFDGTGASVPDLKLLI